jgi:hypothetical protein
LRDFSSISLNNGLIFKGENAETIDMTGFLNPQKFDNNTLLNRVWFLGALVAPGDFPLTKMLRSFCSFWGGCSPGPGIGQGFKISWGMGPIRPSDRVLVIDRKVNFIRREN